LSRFQTQSADRALRGDTMSFVRWPRAGARILPQKNHIFLLAISEILDDWIQKCTNLNYGLKFILFCSICYLNIFVILKIYHHIIKDPGDLYLDQ